MVGGSGSPAVWWRRAAARISPRTSRGHQRRATTSGRRRDRTGRPSPGGGRETPRRSGRHSPTSPSKPSNRTLKTRRATDGRDGRGRTRAARVDDPARQTAFLRRWRTPDRRREHAKPRHARATRRDDDDEKDQHPDRHRIVSTVPTVTRAARAFAPVVASRRRREASESAAVARRPTPSCRSRGGPSLALGPTAVAPSPGYVSLSR